MLLNLPPFVGFVFTPTDLAKATKLSHIAVKKSHIDTLSFEYKQATPEKNETQEHKPSINL